jgi:cell division protein FtsQ
VRSVGPGTGRGRLREPSDALMARGIAVSSRSFRSVELPGFRARPRRARPGAGSTRGNGKWRLLAMLFLICGVAYGATVGGQTGQLVDKAASGVEAIAVAAGFGVKRITVEGQEHTTDAEITKALEAGPATMMLAFDTGAAKARLEQVSWIRHAQVMRLLPSTLQVVVEERVPFAIWQTGGQTFVVDAEGAVLAPATREAYAALPLVVGEGAQKNAFALFETLAPYTDLKQRLAAALRVGDRRWTLKLASGLEIMLPDDGVAQALDALTALDRDRGLLGRDIAAVDLRLADRVSVRLRGGNTVSAGVPGAETPPQDVPTATTKQAPLKGST